MSRNDQRSLKGLLITIAILAAASVILYFTGTVHVNGRSVKGVTDIDKAGQLYAEQYPEDIRLFKDTYTEKQYIDEKCVVHSDVPVPILRFFRINVTPELSYTGKDGNTVEDAIKAVCDEKNKTVSRLAVNASARYVKSKRKYELISGKNGMALNADRIIKLYKTGKKNIPLTPEKVKPDITRKDIQPSIDKANRLLKWKVRYTKGYTIQYPASHIQIKDGALVLKTYNFSNELRHLDKLYQTIGQDRTVKLHDGHKYTTAKGTWCDLTDSKKELTFLKDSFGSLKSVSGRDPEMKKITPKIIVEVSIPEQHVWVYTKSGKQIMQSDCVTGRKGIHDTPTGIFYISQSSKNYTMHGDGYVSHCQRFMRITNAGVALHDAPWRCRFGGNIYTYNGSHGCINLPPVFALKLADKVKVNNTMVIVH